MVRTCAECAPITGQMAAPGELARRVSFSGPDETRPGSASGAGCRTIKALYYQQSHRLGGQRYGRAQHSSALIGTRIRGYVI